MAGALEIVRTIRGHDDAVSSCAYSPDGTRLVTASFDENAIVWDIATGEIVHTLEAHCDPIYDCAWSPDGALIATTGDEPAVALFDANTGACAHEIWPEEFCLGLSSAFGRDGRMVYALNLYGQLWSFDTVSGETESILEGFDGCRFVEASSDSPRLAVGGDALYVLNADDGTTLFDLTEEDVRVLCAAFYPYGRRLLFATEDGRAGIVDVTSGAVLLGWSEDGAVRGCAVSGDGRLAACLVDCDEAPASAFPTDSQWLAVRHALTGTLLTRHPLDCGAQCLEISPTSRTLAIGDVAGALHLISLDSTRRLL